MTNVEAKVQLRRFLDTYCIQDFHMLCHLIQALFPLYVQLSSSLCSVLVLGCFIHVYSVYLMQDSCHPISVWVIGIASIFSLLWWAIYMRVLYVWIYQHSEFFIYSPLLQTLWTLIVKILVYLIQYYACLEWVRSYWSSDLIHWVKHLKILKLSGIFELQPRRVF